MNHTIMQYFEWYLPADHSHWKKLSEAAEHLKTIGITKVWLPPAFKATGPKDVGYGVYDLFDLGEFNQKGSIPTKYGSKEEYLQAINSLQENGIQAIADIVLNHKAGGDSKERFSVLRMNPNNRQEPISQPYDIEGWTHFNFPGRQDTYNNFKWHWYHFTGLDYDALHNETGIYLIQGEGKGWADNETVDGENGNYDYLMFDDIDFSHPEVVQHLKDWIKWFIETTNIDGFRLDAVKHIDEVFMSQFISETRSNIKKNLYVFAEYWKGDTQANLDYIDATNREFDLVDVVLHMNLYHAAQQGSAYDLTRIFDGSLAQKAPEFSVTFVDNHDSQRGQALESTVSEWFKPQAYSLILLRQSGIPCIFYGDYYGISGEYAQRSFQSEIDKLMYLRQSYVYGQEVNYFDHPNCIGWVQLGTSEHPEPLAVLISNSDSGYKDMFVGPIHSGKTFYDYMGNTDDTIIINNEGWARFTVPAGKVSTWIPIQERI